MPSASTLRQLWLIIEHLHTNTLLDLNDLELARKIQEQLNQEAYLSSSEIHQVKSYIQSRIPLIRDSAESRAATI